MRITVLQRADLVIVGSPFASRYDYTLDQVTPPPPPPFYVLIPHLLIESLEALKMSFNFPKHHLAKPITKAYHVILVCMYHFHWQLTTWKTFEQVLARPNIKHFEVLAITNGISG